MSDRIIQNYITLNSVNLALNLIFEEQSNQQNSDQPNVKGLGVNSKGTTFRQSSVLFRKIPIEIKCNY